MRPLINSLTLTQRGLLVAAILLTLGYLGPVGIAAGATDAGYPKNIIIMFGDGMAAPQLELGQYASQHLRGRRFTITDTIFKEGIVGLMTTHAHDGRVTDSAAAGSAMSTGVKTVNGMIAMTPDGQPVPTAMAIAKAWGKRIGLVTTATVYDATPAAFSVHARTRRDLQGIVDQYLVLEPDVVLGGGSDYFLPSSMPGGKRNDEQDVIAAFRAKGYQVIRDTQELRGATGPKILGLFAEKDMSHELDRDSGREPSIARMARAAIRVLSTDSPNGFVLLLETQNTDTAGHRNDLAALIGDLWMFDHAAQLAHEFQRQSPSETLLIVAADHETGGLQLKFTVPELSRASSRTTFYGGPVHLEILKRLVRSIEKVAVKQSKPPSNEALDRLIGERFPDLHFDVGMREAFLRPQLLTQRIVPSAPSTVALRPSRQLEFSWGTTGHTAQPVLVGALGPSAELFQGLLDNTDFGKILHRLIGGQPADGDSSTFQHSLD